MNIRTLIQRARLSGWSFRTSGGVDLSVAVLSSSGGTIQATQDSQPTGQPISFWYGAVGMGLSADGLDFGADYSTTDMTSAGAIYTLTGHALHQEDFQGGCVLVSASVATGYGASANLFFFGAPIALTVAAMAAQNAPMLALLPAGIGILPAAAGAVAGYFAERSLWRSFKGFATVGGETRGFATPGISYMRGIMR